MKAGELFDRQSTKKIKAFIAGVNLNDPNFDYYMTELRELALANNLDVVGQAKPKRLKISLREHILVLVNLIKLKIWLENYMLKL